MAVQERKLPVQQGKQEGGFVRECFHRTRSNTFKLEESRFRSEIREKVFTVRVMRTWNRLLEKLQMPHVALT